MDHGTLIKYIASAGSGKTTELTAKYISKLFSTKNSYRKILAVTFTNKAASEMKSRILGMLREISCGDRQAEAGKIADMYHTTPEAIVEKAKITLDNILHDYSRFSVGTIDSFFQRVLKAFTKESGLQSGYTIELDHSMILSAAVTNMLESLGDDKKLQEWINEFAKTRVEEGKTWNIQFEIIDMAEELFREKFKLLNPGEKEKLRNRELLSAYEKELKSVRAVFTKYLKNACLEILDLNAKHGVTDDMFFQGKRGLPAFIKKIGETRIETSDNLNSYVLKVLDDTPRFCTGSVPAGQLASAMKDGLGEKLIESVRYFNNNLKKVNTADAILSNIYTLGILSDVLDHIHSITTAENKFLLSDAGELLYLIIGNDQTPFIYEKIGNSFENYMIDEFQDTSAIQWKNFKPLIDNSMGEGFDNLVVGDVKQSIYRWRNSDWKILDSVLKKDIGENRVKNEKLDTNYRSRENIIAFNNSVFSLIPGILDSQSGTDTISFSSLYADAVQKTGGNKKGGYIKFDFIEETEENDFKTIVLGRLPHIIEDLQDKGYKGSDIGILVRSNREGSEILKYILDYRASAPISAGKKYNYDVISNESLILDQNPVVCFIIAFLKWINNPSDDISRALVLRNWFLSTGRTIPENEVQLLERSGPGFESIFPEGSLDFVKELKDISLFEAIENIINKFSLGEYSGNTPYLSALQDCVLEYTSGNSSEVSAFLEWWDDFGSRKSIILSEQQDSIRVMTIHKCKGLQFGVVIIPFLTWQMAHDKNPTLWLKPRNEPFNMLDLVPVKYKKSLLNSYFEDDYNEEKFSSVVDNLNILYVAFTRAVDCLIGFCPAKYADRSMTAAALLKASMSSDQYLASEPGKPVMVLKQFAKNDPLSFSCGEIPLKTENKKVNANEVSLKGYNVSISPEKLKLKFHGEDFIIKMADEQVRKLNYGKLMHEMFSHISDAGDIKNAVLKLVLEGKIPEDQREDFEEKVAMAISDPRVREWFDSSSVVKKEIDILLPSGSTKRPDRIIIKNQKVTVVDFKFGLEKKKYIDQVNTYRHLLNQMGYKEVDAFIWYVDINRIISV